MEPTTAISILLSGLHLKTTPRTGWVLRGLTDAESVADHSFGVIFITLLLIEVVDAPVDAAKALTIAALHDLPEAVTGDIPAPAQAYFAGHAKSDAEARVLAHQLSDLPVSDLWQAWWREFEDGTSVEGRLVHDADRLDLLMQAHLYEMATGNRRLDEFWTRLETSDFAFDASREIFIALKRMRGNTSDG